MLTSLIAATLLFVLAGLGVGILILLRLGKAAESGLDQTLRAELRVSREEASSQARNLREEVATAQGKANEMLVKMVGTLGSEQKELLAGLNKATREASEATRRDIETMLLEQRRQMGEVVAALGGLRDSNRQDQEKAREILEQKFRHIQESNEKKLDEMRRTVDEKLQSTLEKRLGESFKLVSERLEAVQRGLGEMQSLATGVGDLKRVLTNVKERGTWGESQLGAILDDILTPEQFSRNVRPKEGGEVVEFAVKLPGKGSESDKPVWLPIDAKFPKEDYERLLEAANQADAEQLKTASKALALAISKSAKDIHDKYIAPPATTDFAILFLPTEGLYAEVLRQPGLHDELQRKYRVMVAGPTTLSAILSSLRVGFQTLAIESRAHDVWQVLGAVKTEFGKFGDVLEKVQKQLNTASKTLEESQQRTRVMVRTLKKVEQLPAEQAVALLDFPDAIRVPAKEEAPDF